VKRALLALLWFSACKLPDVRPQAARNPAQGIVFITTSLKGYLGPCGCSENMRGGIARAAFQISQAHDEGATVLVVDSGDALFGSETLTEEAAPQQKRKAQALADALKLMGVNAKADGPLDLAAGKDFLDALRLPPLREGVSVLDIGPGPNAPAVGVITTGEPARLKELAQQARDKGARLVVALYQRPLAEAQKLGMEDELGVDLLVVARAPGEADAETNKLISSKLPIAQAQAKGRSLLRLDVYDVGADGAFVLAKGAAEQERELEAIDQRIEALRTQVNEPGLAPQLLELKKQKLTEVVARRAAIAATPPTLPRGKNAFTVRFVPLESSMPELPVVRDVVTRYDRDVGKLNLQWASAHGRECPAPEAGQPRFVGDETCRDCHEAAFPIWEKSKHHDALATLEKKGKALHLDCVGCHVTGWQQPSGVCRIDKLEGHGQVGCESCHGPGSNHVEDPQKSNIANLKSPQVCVGCHDHENSPSFDFEKYLAQITGKGHGDGTRAEGKKPAP